MTTSGRADPTSPTTPLVLVDVDLDLALDRGPGALSGGAAPALTGDDARLLVWVPRVSCGDPQSPALRAPTSRDAAAVRAVLTGRAAGGSASPSDGVQVVECPDVASLCMELADGAAAAVVADEALTLTTLAALATVLAQQPSWSDVPLIVLARPEAPVEAIVERLAPAANVTIVERPARPATLRGVVRSALRARRRQHQQRGLLERLGESDRRKDEFLAVLGHELRNPLAAIRNAAALLEGFVTGDPRAARLRTIIERQSHGLTRMVEDLLDVTRVTAGKFVLRREPMDLSLVVARVKQACDELARECGQTLTLRLPEAPVLVDGDPVRLEQVTSNLLRNALKYTPDGGHVAASVDLEGERVLLRVVDDGVGIEPGMLDRIFELFAQVPSTLDRAQGGLGLGLPLVRRIVTLHGGEVEAYSPGLGRGSTFTVRLPLLRALAARAEPAAPAAPARLRVAVVEDNPDIRECMTELLEAWGHEVAAAPDGRAGLDLIVDTRPDVAIVDVGLPRLDGYEVARAVRSHPAAQGVRLIAMTGYGQAQDRERALEAGFHEHLVKPVNPDALSRLLSRPREVLAAG